MLAVLLTTALAATALGLVGVVQFVFNPTGLGPEPKAVLGDAFFAEPDPAMEDAELRCLPFVPTAEAQESYRVCRAGKGDHRLCLTAARRVTAGETR